MEQYAHSWQRPPEPIRKFVKEETADVVVIGAGIAGVVATHSAAEAGASVICVEKFGKFTAHGTDVGSLNTKLHKRSGITIDPKRADYLLAELTWQPSFAPGLSVTGSYGLNGGTLIGRSHGGMLTLAYQGLIKKKK